MPQNLDILTKIGKKKSEEQKRNPIVKKVPAKHQLENQTEKVVQKKEEVVVPSFENELVSTTTEEVQETNEDTENEEIFEDEEKDIPEQEVKPKTKPMVKPPAVNKPKNTMQNSTTYDELPPNHPAKFVKRDDQPASQYSKKGFPSSYTIYDKKLRKILKNFSDDNQYNEGCPIPQSFIIESMMGILFYDLGIEPIGYQTKEEFLQDIKERLNIE